MGTHPRPMIWAMSGSPMRRPAACFASATHSRARSDDETGWLSDSRAMSDVPPGARRITQQGSTFYVLGEQTHPLRDAYHSFLKARWPVSLSMIAIGFFAVNIVFAVV